MKKISIIIFILLFSGLLWPTSLAMAQVNIDKIKITEPEGGRVTLSWTTDQAATAYVYFGQSRDNLAFYVGNLDYKFKHQAVLSGLKRNQDYYYKIQVKNQAGQVTESFINYFNTVGMAYTTAPSINNFKLLQAIDQAAAFAWQTDRETRIEFYYGLEADNLNQVQRNRSYQTDHLLVITRQLEPAKKYYYQLTVSDRDGNQRSRSGSFNTSRYAYEEISINNLIPTSYNQTPSMPERAIIAWQSNLLASSQIVYGTEPNRLRSRLTVNSSADFEHYAVLENLQPDTVYYYQIKMSTPLGRINTDSQIYSFKTAPLSQDYLNLYWQSGDLVSYRRNNYLIYQDVLVPIYNNQMFNNLSVDQEIKEIEARYLAAYNQGPAYYGLFFDGQVIKEANNNTVYLIAGQYRRPIANWAVFTYLNYTSSDIKIVSRAEMRSYKLGAVITHSQQMTGANWGASLNNQLVKGVKQKTVYLIINNKKLPFLNEAVFKRSGYCFDQVRELEINILNQFELGQVII